MISVNFYNIYNQKVSVSQNLFLLLLLELSKTIQQ